MRYREMEDEELMRLVQSQELFAFEQLYDRHAPMALGYLYKVLGERSIAEEALQETFFRIWCNSARFKVDRSCFQTWVYTIAYCAAFDIERKMQQSSM